MRDAIPPTSRKELIPFLGLASYYRRFTPEFANIARPLNEKTSGNVKFTWSDGIQTAFEELKVKLTSVPTLSYPDYEKPFVLCTNASSRELTAVLSQEDENGRNHPIHYSSRAQSAVESNYSAFEGES